MLFVNKMHSDERVSTLVISWGYPVDWGAVLRTKCDFVEYPWERFCAQLSRTDGLQFSLRQTRVSSDDRNGALRGAGSLIPTEESLRMFGQ